jgi:hypothetical protein
MKDEPRITVNGVPLNDAQAMAVRVALGNFHLFLKEKDAKENLGAAMAKVYRDRVREIYALMGL